MGRTKTQLKKIENQTYRHITFAKRKCGIIKKAYELSTLCDIELALLIFSPAGKLFLYEGNKRLEEIIQRFIDLPEEQRGRLQDKEFIQRIINKMGLETHLYLQFLMAERDPAAEMEEIQSEMMFCNAELEEIEKELSYFLKSPSCIQTLSEAEQHEMILEDALKNVQFRKQVLGRFESFTTSDEPYYPMLLEETKNFMLGCTCHLNPNMNPQINVDPNTLINVSGQTGLIQPFSNQEQAFPGMIQLSPTLLNGYQLPSQNVQSNGQNFNAYAPQPHQSGQLADPNLPSTSGTNNIEQGSAALAPGQSQDGDPALGCFGGAFFPEFDLDDFNPFQF